MLNIQIYITNQIIKNCGLSKPHFSHEAVLNSSMFFFFFWEKWEMSS